MSKASHWSVSVIPAVERVFLWDHGVSTSPRIINCSASGSPAHCGTLQRALPSALVRCHRYAGCIPFFDLGIPADCHAYSHNGKTSFSWYVTRVPKINSLWMVSCTNKNLRVLFRKLFSNDQYIASRLARVIVRHFYGKLFFSEISAFLLKF
ncbi:unnamed protein product [Musa hybrid cultivar]